MRQAAENIKEQLIAWRRDFHKHPELSFKEIRTARIVAETLESFGIKVETEVGITGVVGTIGEGKPVVGIRGDMDALPIQEINQQPYCSVNDGVMHACGHDAHTAILLGVAKMLSEVENLPAGTIKLLFQPSEESWDEELKSGATRMIEDGALDDLDYVIALHVDSTTPVNACQIGGGFVSASVDSFEAKIIGKGGHGAYPHETVDPIFALAQVINAINGIVARRIKPLQPAVISLGKIHTGFAPNVIPGEVNLNGTIRSYDDGVRAQLEEELKRAFSVAEALGCTYELEIQNAYPSLENSHEVADVIREATVDLYDESYAVPTDPGMGAEDFSYMIRKANGKGAMFILGAKFDEQDRPHHNAIFDIHEDCLPTGAAILAETAIRLLQQ